MLGSRLFSSRDALLPMDLPYFETRVPGAVPVFVSYYMSVPGLSTWDHGYFKENLNARQPGAVKSMPTNL